MTPNHSPKPSDRNAFTLVELLVATAILMLMLGFLLTVTGNVGSTVAESSVKLDAYATGRLGFDIVANTLSRGTLNTYWTYYNSQGQTRTTSTSATVSSTSSTYYQNFVPVTYGRASNLQFVVRTNTNEGIIAGANSGYYGQEVDFSYPAGYSTTSTILDTQGLLNNCSFFVQYGSDALYKPAMFTTGANATLYRYRLFQAIMDTTNFEYFVSGANALGATPSWITQLDGNAQAYWRPLADNVIALIVWPQDPEDPSANSSYDPAGNPVISGTELQTNYPKTNSGYTYDSQFPYGYSGYSSIWGGGSSMSASSFPITFCQSPPTVQLTLVLIDDASAKRLCTSAIPPSLIENALAGKFVNPTNYRVDLYGGTTTSSPNLTGTYGLINYLSIFDHINCQVLNTKIVLRESKWSK